MNVEPEPGDSPMTSSFHNPPVTLSMMISETIYQAVMRVERLVRRVAR